MDVEKMTLEELNVAMAELMGWHYWDSDFRDYDGEYPMYIVLDALLIVYDEANKHREFSPSTDIAAAMQVLLKLEELEPTATIRLSNGDGDSCDVDILTDTFCKLNTVHISLDGGWELMPEAICRAAVLAAEAGK